MLDYVLTATEQYLSSKTKTERKKIGQFFTPAETARFMAGLFNIPQQETLSILDPGAGTGILSAALIERLQGCPNLQQIDVTCYENELETMHILESNLLYISGASRIPLNYRIISENYITSQNGDFNYMLYRAEDPIKYDIVIGNPPYKKIPKNAPEAAAMPLVCYGAPNLYFLFASMSLFNLRQGGELVYIMPRSWTSGAYFKAFRDYLMTEGKLTHLHLFVSRDKVFDKEKILQETIIVKVRKQEEPVDSVEITSSVSSRDFNSITRIIAPYNCVVSKKERYVFLVTSKDELETLTRLSDLDYTLPSVGLKMKTGLTVDFRNKKLLRDKPSEDAVPMFYSQHIQAGKVVFPVKRENEYISSIQSGLVQKNRNYVFVKRFTSKEEKRRLQCGVYLSQTLPDYTVISTQNKINFIDTVDGEGLQEDVAYGIYVLLNSTIYDIYYRILNGSTQVNSTEVNAMPVPSLSRIKQMGRSLRHTNDYSVQACDHILSEALA